MNGWIDESLGIGLLGVLTMLMLYALYDCSKEGKDKGEISFFIINCQSSFLSEDLI